MPTRPIPRNEECPCGSGRRYKHCCGSAGTAAPHAENPSTIPEDSFAAALKLHQAGRIDEAERIYVRILDAHPMSPHVLHYLGVCCYQRGNHEAAARHIRAALEYNDREPLACNNLGLVYKEQNRLDEALACFDKALDQDPANALAYNNRGLVLIALHRFDDAVRDFTQAARLKSDIPEVFSNLAKVLFEQKHYAEALAACNKAIALNPALAAAYAIRGSALSELERYDEAFASWSQAIALKPDFAEVYFNRGSTLHNLGRYEEASASHDRAIAIKPELPYLRGDWLHDRMRCCNWADFEAACTMIVTAIDRGDRVSSPFMLLSIPATPAQCQRCARIFVGDQFPPNPVSTWRGERYAHERIRIGYVSADYRDHPTSHLIAEFIERHDRSLFEAIGIYVGPPVADAWRTRMEVGFDQFFDVRTSSDEEISALIRSLEIDIAVDLMGHTAFGRPGVFARRPAPVQVNYLGYPGTMGAPYIDYLIADPILIPPECRQFYDEKIAYVPNSYQVNDSTKRIADRPMCRAEVDLPEDGFVFCCFNKSFKITPDAFDIWMRLLRKVPVSVLWLMDSNTAANANLRREAERRGISPDRLVFAPRMALAEHLARHRCADLFLDTFHYNGHTTASDALWAGLPVLTCLGETFAGRVAASLLNAIGLPELITRSRAEYEALALELAMQPDHLAALRRKLAENRKTQPLFDTALSTRHIEMAYRRMHTLHHAGLPPDHIVVSA